MSEIYEYHFKQESCYFHLTILRYGVQCERVTVQFDTISDQYLNFTSVENAMRAAILLQAKEFAIHEFDREIGTGKYSGSFSDGKLVFRTEKYDELVKIEEAKRNKYRLEYREGCRKNRETFLAKPTEQLLLDLGDKKIFLKRKIVNSGPCWSTKEHSLVQLRINDKDFWIRDFVSKDAKILKKSLVTFLENNFNFSKSDCELFVANFKEWVNIIKCESQKCIEINWSDEKSNKTNTEVSP